MLDLESGAKVEPGRLLAWVGRGSIAGKRDKRLRVVARNANI